MRFAIASQFACATSWWARLQDEGHDVRVWIAENSHKTIGDGIVQKLSWENLVAWAREGECAMLFDSSGLGAKADEVRAHGIPTLCGGSFMDKLEKDRSFGFRIATEAGMDLPPFAEFRSISECIAAAPHVDRPVYFKSDKYLGADATHKCENAQELVEYLEGVRAAHGDAMTCMLQAKMDGVAYSTARWWNGRAFVGPFEGTIEHKALMNDDVGPSTGCSFNATWFYDDENPAIAQALRWENLAAIFRKHDAPAGLYDVNAVALDDGHAAFLEWTPRLGYDSEMTVARLMPNLGEFLAAVALGTNLPQVDTESLAYAVRLSVPPYPSEDVKRDEKASPHGKVRIGGTDGLWDKHFIAYCVRRNGDGLEMASPEGIVGLSLAVGDDLEAMEDACVEYAGEMSNHCSVRLQYRTDGAERIAEDAERILDAGFEIPGGIL